MSDFRALDKFFDNIDFVVPGYERSSQYMVAIHRAFYEWARDRIAGAEALDAGCGEGYGADILAQTAERVVGIDIKPELVAHARRRYQRPNLDFRLMDCEAMNFGHSTFDVVVSNELIEHLPDFEAFLVGAQKVLRSGGRFMCATTNAGISFGKSDATPMNRNHYREFDASGLRAELSKYFDTCQIYSETMNERFRAFTLDRRARAVENLLIRIGVKHRIPIRLRNFVRQALTGVDLDRATEAGFEIVEGEVHDALYLIGVAEKRGWEASGDDT